MITINMNNSQKIRWYDEYFDDYEFNEKFFIIIRNNKQIGFYNLDHVYSIIIAE